MRGRVPDYSALCRDPRSLFMHVSTPTIVSAKPTIKRLVTSGQARRGGEAPGGSVG